MKRTEVVQRYGGQQIKQMLAEYTPYQLHGEIYTYDNGVSVVCTTAGTYYAITGLTDGIDTGTPYVVNDGTNGQIDIGTLGAGIYQVVWSISFSADKVCVVHGDIYIDSTEKQNVAFQRKISSANDVGNASSSGLLTLAAGESLSCRIKSDTNTTTVSVPHMNLHITKIGAA